MSLVYETTHFEVIAHQRPQVCRSEGGHIKIVAKRVVEDRTKLNPEEAIDLIRATMLVGEAMTIGMTNRGIKIIKINYQDNGNWAFKYGKKPQLHVHLYARCENSKHHPFPEAIVSLPLESGYYDGFEPLNQDDINEIQKQISILEKTDKYKKENWFK